jgi:alanyl-tRNA synthetase
MTERLYYTDSYLREFQARVIEAAEGGLRVYLDRSAFYPSSGGQPFDTGRLGGAAVRDVIDEDGRIAHVLESPLQSGVAVTGAIDWTRRFDHMQQHTGQHLLSAVLQDLFGWPTVSFHLGAEVSMIDVRTAAAAPEQLERAEERCAEIVAQARPVLVSFEESSAELELRKASQREGTLRILTIEGIDRSACGGTHVRSTAEIGPVLTRKIEKIRDTTRIEFVCGGRALRRARQDFRLLAGISRTLSAPMEGVPERIAGLIERNGSLEKTAQKLGVELAAREGRDLYQSSVSAEDGIRYAIVREPLDDTVRARAQAFVAGAKAAYLAISEDPAAVLLAVSADSGFNAGALVKSAAIASGGRGGGNPVIAQASAPSLDRLLESLESAGFSAARAARTQIA